MKFSSKYKAEKMYIYLLSLNLISLVAYVTLTVIFGLNTCHILVLFCWILVAIVESLLLIKDAKDTNKVADLNVFLLRVNCDLIRRLAKDVQGEKDEKKEDQKAEVEPQYPLDKKDLNKPYEPEIGSAFSFDGRYYETVEYLDDVAKSRPCYLCDLDGKDCKYIVCNPVVRTDNRAVIFKKVTDVCMQSDK